MYRRMSAVLKPLQLSTSMVIAPNDRNEWPSRTIIQDMEKAIIDHHIKNTALLTTHL
jgi:hypothetical protein